MVDTYPELVKEAPFVETLFQVIASVNALLIDRNVDVRLTLTCVDVHDVVDGETEEDTLQRIRTKLSNVYTDVSPFNILLVGENGKENTEQFIFQFD